MPYEKLEISTPKPVLSWANHALGPKETNMAKNVASLPFVFKHVALMPDVHLGNRSSNSCGICRKQRSRKNCHPSLQKAIHELPSTQLRSNILKTYRVIYASQLQ
ncbi:hypothetical protein [Tychonema bourrellyi]|uniref:hypothetical protein n=1 Tax=Tychonema bourrellyi TaxID=54313 RepID=UPI0026B4D6E8